MLRKLVAMMMALCLVLAMVPAGAEGEKTVSWDDILALRQEIADMEARLAEMEKQYALENANRLITVDQPEVLVIVKKSVTLTANVEKLLDSAPETTRLVWETSDKAVAKVDKKGKITGVAAGTCVITVKAADDETIAASATVTVIQPVKKIVLSEKSVTLGIREPVKGKPIAGSVQVTATVTPDEAYDKSVTWTSSDESVVKVADGLITAVGGGSATVTATANDGSGVKATVKVKVVRGAETIQLDVYSLTLARGKSSTVKAIIGPENAGNKNVVWASSDESVATVSAKGVVKGVGAGTCVITATTTDGSNLTAKCSVTVNEPVTKLTPSQKTVYMKEGESYTPSVTAEPAAATNKTVLYTSSDPLVVEVASGGVLKANSYGTVTITATAQDGSGKKTTFKVVVEPKIPLILTRVKVGRNSIESPEVFLSVKNVSSNTDVIAFTFATRCYDAYGNLLKAHGFGDTTEYWIWQEGVIRAGKSWSSDWWRWTLYGFDTAYTIEVWLTDIQTSDGRTIYVPKTDATTWTWSKY